MSVKIDGTSITMTRGDTLKVQFIPILKNNEEYTEYAPASGDTIRFAMKRRYEDNNVLISKAIPTDTFLLHLRPEDTKSLRFGHYVYDVELTYANGEVDTYIDKATLTLSEEVD